MSAVGPVAKKIQATYGDDLIAYYPLGDSSAPFVDELGLSANLTSFGAVSAGQTGVGDGNTAVSMGPGSSRIQSSDAYFKSNVDGNLGSMGGWIKFDWGSASQLLNIFNADNSSYLAIEKNTSDVLSFTRKVSGVFYSCSVDLSGETVDDFISILVTWNQGEGELFLYVNGVERATRDGAMNTWDVSAEASVNFRVGWSFGDAHTIAHVPVWATRALTPSDAAAINASRYPRRKRVFRSGAYLVEDTRF